MKNKTTLLVLPILLNFFVMGFCDVVGIATSYIKSDFGLSETLSGFIPSMVFIWFLILSIPSSLLMNRIGRKKTVQLSNIITFVAMLLPLFHYDMVFCMTAFILLGIGNTMLQVSLNPLLASVVKGDNLASSLTLGQVIKAVSSFCGPFIAAFAVASLGKWSWIFPIYAGFTLLSALLLAFVKIPETDVPQTESLGFTQAFGLLKDKEIFLAFLGIFFVVGVDVGTNMLSPKIMMERAGWAIEKAGLASSLYFICRTAGAFVGTILLAKINEVKYFKYTIFAAIVSILPLMFVKNPVIILVCIGLIGFLCSSIFSIIFSVALKLKPEKANEISGFMITGVFGGAVIPPLMGFATDIAGGQLGSVVIILVCMCYLAWCALRFNRADVLKEFLGTYRKRKTESATNDSVFLLIHVLYN